jgi:hypothetical protein
MKSRGKSEKIGEKKSEMHLIPEKSLLSQFSRTFFLRGRVAGNL